eukprot:354717-Chlamydomonas_euryale.AAC.4
MEHGGWPRLWCSHTDFNCPCANAGATHPRNAVTGTFFTWCAAPRWPWNADTGGGGSSRGTEAGGGGANAGGAGVCPMSGAKAGGGSAGGGCPFSKAKAG